ncbi:hypothetical protein B0J11DRAFT_133270 [Dendryphion nanum]|uniref:F-box domain-containing protein n=1 Tax=Dendryphion nanum TaxID=256645 RepID=A0A9P9D8C3_9PLEO|nr:hypothetical protein B0J11DRAFT_133270 [Dendryphion nanum]
MPSMTRTLVDASIPGELLLGIIENLTFDKKVMRDISLVHPRLRSLVLEFQYSITKKFASNQLHHATTDFTTDETANYRWLARCIRRYDVIDEVMDVLISEKNRLAVHPHNMGVTNTGMLLLYRLFDVDGIDNKIAFIKSLPRSPILAMFLAIHFSIFAARHYGKGIINDKRYGPYLDGNNFEMRSEVEFSFAEGVMELGPQFISDIILGADNAENTLMLFFHDHAFQDWNMHTIQSDFVPINTQGPHREPGTRSRSLWTTVQERLADLSDCPLNEVVDRVIEEIEEPGHWHSWMGLAGKAELMKGLNLTNEYD